METEKKTFNVQKENLQKLKTKISFIQKKGQKLGAQIPHFKVLREYTKEVKENGKTYEVEMVEVEVDSVKTSLSGWKFMATIDHHEAGNVIRFSPKYNGDFNVEKYRTAKPHCDHCSVQRRRNDTFIMVNESGDTKQIGRSCIKDFLGHPSAEYYAQWAEWIYLISQEEDEKEFRMSGKWVELFDVMEVLEASAMLIRLHGYRSAKNAGTRATTSGQLRFWMDATPKKYQEEMKEEKPYPSEEDKEVAKRSYEMVMGWEGSDLKSDFNYNLNALCKRGKLVDRDLGMMAYVPEMLMKTIAKQMEDAKKRKQEQEAAAKSNYIGNLKERITVEVDLVKSFWLGASQFGDSYLYSFSDSNGNVIVWKTGSELKINTGSKVKLVGTVKEQKEYKGTKQTHLTRCKIEVL
jgi:hypothetical protein